jgi:opacity protein-like surface antigen
MKKMLLATALAAVIASPALAQSGSRKAVAPAYGQAVPLGAWQGSPFGAYAQSPRSASQPYGVYENGKFIGADPDPNVRLMLRKDAGSENF